MAPQLLLGREPMVKTSLPPAARSLWRIQGRSSGLPLSVAFWMYLFSEEAPSASMTKVRPEARRSVTFEKKGVPMLYTGIPGVTG